jgi:hypothetical protein
LSPARVDHNNAIDITVIFVTTVLFCAAAPVRSGVVRHTFGLLSLVLLRLPFQVFDLALEQY